MSNDGKVKKEKCQKVDTCEYKIDTDSDGNLMPIRMYKVLFLHKNISDLNKSVKRKIVLFIYNN